MEKLQIILYLISILIRKFWSLHQMHKKIWIDSSYNLYFRDQQDAEEEHETTEGNEHIQTTDGEVSWWRWNRNIWWKSISDKIIWGNCLGVDLNRNFPSGWGRGHKSFIDESELPSTSVYKAMIIL